MHARQRTLARRRVAAMREPTALAVLLLVVAASVNAVHRGGGVLQADLAALDVALADLETDVVDTTGTDGGEVTTVDVVAPPELMTLGLSVSSDRSIGRREYPEDARYKRDTVLLAELSLPPIGATAGRAYFIGLEGGGGAGVTSEHEAYESALHTNEGALDSRFELTEHYLRIHLPKAFEQARAVRLLADTGEDGRDLR